jgi:hypothetical protein
MMNENALSAGATRSARSSLVCATTLALLVMGVHTTAAFAQDPQPAVRGVAPGAERSVGAWIADLGAEDVEVRKAAEKALAARGAEVLGELEAAAEEHQDPEVQWRARRVARRIRAGAETEGLKPRDATPPPVAEGRPARPLPGGDASRMLEEIRAQMEEMRRRIEEMSGGGGIDVFDRMESMQSATSVQIGPDGVRVEVKETGDDGEPVTRVYEAESMEALREKHPELGARVGFGMRDLGEGAFPGIDLDLDILGPGGTWVTPEGVEIAPPGAGGLPFRGRVLRPGQLRPRAAHPVDVVESTPPAEGERLGIYIGDLDPAVRDFLEIAEGRGLLVSSVEEGSLGAELGLRAKDVVLQIGGRVIRSAADVRAALREIAKGEDVVVEVNRMGATKRLEAAKQHDAPKPAQALRRG